MNRILMAALCSLALGGLASPARALPLIDISVGGGVVLMGDDPAGAVSAGLHVPLGPWWGAQASYSRTVIDGSLDRSSGSIDYRGQLLGGFLTLTSPSPGIKFRGKVGLKEARFSLRHGPQTKRLSSIGPALGVAVLSRSWQIEAVRSRIDDGSLDRGITRLSLNYVW